MRIDWIMKKLLYFTLILSICITLCACDGTAEPFESTEIPTESTCAVTIEATEPPQKETIYKLGDVIETDLFKITPCFTGYAYELANWPDENFMTPMGEFSGTSPYSASTGKIQMYGEVQIEYIGNEKSNVFLDVNVFANYDDRYIFETVHMGNCFTVDGSWGYTGQMVFEPLSNNNTRILRYCIEVPEQVETNIDKSLLVTFFVNGEPFIFDFRSTDALGSDFDPRAEFYQSVDDETKAKIVDYLKANDLTAWGWYDNTFGLYTFAFEDTAVEATLPINSDYQYEFTGTYEVFSGTILITWDYGQQMHMDYTFDGASLDILSFEHDR